jgi:hypothetical protein
MTPIDFMSLADRLLAVDGLAERRSAVSRAYYYAFHVCLQFVEGCGIPLPKSAEAHAKLIMCLKNCGNLDLHCAGIALNELRTARNIADYRLDDPEYEQRKNARSKLIIAAQVASWVSSASVAESRDLMRSYANNVLGIVLKK